MIVVLASRTDECAERFVSRFAGGQAVLATPRDLSMAGWRLGQSPEQRVMVAGGERLRVAAVRAVLTLLPQVWDGELLHLIESERSYVAAEMTSFLLYFLSTVPCPVFNRPTPECLSGPNWRTEQWLRAAAGAGIPIKPQRRCAKPDPTPETVSLSSALSVTVIEGQCLGDAGSRLQERAGLLAKAAGVHLLTAFFEADADNRLIGASGTVDLSRPDVAETVQHALLRQ
jgi:hypothetical protein